MTDSHETKSEKLFRRAESLIPGGVNSPVRAFKAVGEGAVPPFIARGQGAHIWDVDGAEYIDYVGSWGPLIVGHAHPAVVRALRRAVKTGSSFGAPTEAEVQLARVIVKALPSVQMVRLVNSGTEATMTALRLARGFTGRDLIVKCEGCYHGHADGLLVKAGSGAATLGIPTSPGVPDAYAACTLTVPFNDLDAMRAVFDEHGRNIAAVIVEPVAGNMGCVPPADGYLDGVRDITKRVGTLLIFDEVMTGFRVGYGGAQSLYGVTPDLTCLGKIVGGGLPVGAVGGARKIMRFLAPAGPVYQAGTLSGNPLAVAAGRATLKECARDGFYEELERKALALTDGLVRIAQDHDIPVTINRVGSMWTLFYRASAGDEPVRNFADASASDMNRWAQIFRELLARGVYLPASQYEAAFVSAAHTDDDIEQTLAAYRDVFAAL